MRVDIYIRKENEDKWNSLENKSKWVNDRLGGLTAESPAPNEGTSPSPSTKKNSSADAEIPECCLTQKQCKHWRFDPLSSVWQNHITGEVREIYE